MSPRTRLSLFQAVVLVAVSACGPAVVDEGPPRCLSLSVPAGSEGLSTSMPAKVSLFFSVDRCSGEPVAGLDAAHFTISEDGKAVSTFESQRTIQPKGQAYRMSSLLLVDLSGSVLRSGQFPALKKAGLAYASAVLGKKQDGHRLAVMAFDGRERPQLVANFTDDLSLISQAFDSLEQKECSSNADCAGFIDHRTCGGWRCIDDSTNLNGALIGALDALDQENARQTTIQWKDSALVVLTDGTDQAARVSQLDAMQRASQARSHIFAVGLGGEVDEAVMRAFGKDGYWPVSKSDQLASTFESIATRVTGLANRFYMLEYCSPKRSGKHTLKVTAEIETADGPLIGGITREFDASGFGSGCSL